eukprot:416294-Prorocentrum_lima.AAC.1
MCCGHSPPPVRIVPQRGSRQVSGSRARETVAGVRVWLELWQRARLAPEFGGRASCALQAALGFAGSFVFWSRLDVHQLA